MTAVEQLRAQFHLMDQQFHAPRMHVACGIPRINEWLPDKGLELGSYIELIKTTDGSTAYSVALALGRNAIPHKTAWAVLDASGNFNPAAAALAGWDVRQLILIRTHPNDAAWAFTQLLCSKEIGVCFWSSANMDNLVFRRLQLAAERGGGLGILIRPPAALHKPCWGSLRIQVANAGGRNVRLQLLKARGQPQLSHPEIEVTL